jgi:hypothetical protein
MIVVFSYGASNANSGAGLFTFPPNYRGLLFSERSVWSVGSVRYRGFIGSRRRGGANSPSVNTAKLRYSRCLFSCVLSRGSILAIRGLTLTAVNKEKKRHSIRLFIKRQNP